MGAGMESRADRRAALSADMKNCPLADMKVPVRGQ